MKPKKDNQEPILNAGETSLAAPEPVSSLLRRHRKQTGQDLKTVAQALRIRYVYLEAIEQGRYDALPGSTYALGFIKTYAEYLDLDEEEIVQRFREDVDGLDDQTQLVFPSPVPEGKVPGGAILLVALIMGALAYGGWYGLSSRDSRLVDFIPALPDRLQALFQDESAEPESAIATVENTPAEAPVAENKSEENASGESAAESGTGGAPAAAESAVAAVATAQPSAPAPSPEPSQTSQTAAPAATPAPAATTSEPSSTQTTASIAAVPAAPAQTQAQAPAQTQAQSQPATAAGSTVPQTGTTVISSETVTSLSSSETEIPAAPAAPIPTQTVSVPDATQPQVYGEDNADARIILRATQDAWVQVRDRSDELLLTRVLREGDVYRVPNEEGLTLLTGNAGGIEVLVDGTLMAPLGPVGSVRRDLALDPQVLLAGATQQ
ncbi:helix-turn-helix domain-containing protein [Denitrobaculum tricleocarpae]|uniref:helix-turn-helix domain-containing protein n=1 Tax=Denitrobaculum tricleocarpae TaxID=2591009 RepID=UPI0015D239A3|nr:helix-turn-helix domain-containing protein [Denitrobaculum tricleocarpae]